MAEYDAMGNYTGFDDQGYGYEPVVPGMDDEERKREELRRQIEEAARQESELASEVAHKQEVTTYGDGSRTVKTTQEVPAGPVAPQGADQSAYTAQMESGNRPDIGYHDRSRGTAYGTYGLTAPAYQDVQRANPQFAGRDITTLSPEEQKAAYQTYTGLNANALQRFGVEPSEANQRLAHFLGAKGAAEFLKSGTISPAAAAANGGEGNVRRIAQARLAGGAAPASGAASLVQGEQAGVPTAPVAPTAEPFTGQGLKAPVAQTAPQTSSEDFINRYQDAQNDPSALMKMATGDTTPDWLKDRARNRAADLITEQRETQKAQEKLATATPNDLARYLQGKSKQGEDYNLTTRIRAMLFSASGNNDLAQREWNKLDTTGTDKYVQGPDGKPYLVRQRADGEILGGFNATTGAALTPDEIVKVGAGFGQGKWQTSAEFFQDKAGNVFQAQHNDKGQTRMVDVKTGAPYQGEAKLERLRDVSRLGQMEQAQAYRRENDMSQFARNIAGMDYKGKLAAVADARQAAINRGEPDFTEQELANLGVTRPSLNLYSQTGQVAGAPAAQPTARPTAQPTGPVAPVGNIPAGPVSPTAPTARMSVEEMKRKEAEQKLAREATSQVDVDTQKRFNEYVEKDIQPKADAGKLISRVRKEQINGPDGILNNPEIAGMMQGSQSGEVGNILRDLITGNFKDQADLSTRVAALNLTPRQKEVLYTQIGLNNQILPQTLKANAGPGAISEAEHKINRDANVDITRQPLYSGLSLMTRDQFQKDMQVARNDFRSANPEIKTTDSLNKAWSVQERAANEAYDRIYAARAAYIAKHNPTGANPGAAVDAFKYYPAPSWNGSSWDYGTEYAKKAARKPLGSFNN